MNKKYKNTFTPSTKNINAKLEINRLEKKYSDFTFSILKLESKIHDFVLFDFSIEQP